MGFVLFLLMLYVWFIPIVAHTFFLVNVLLWFIIIIVHIIKNNALLLCTISTIYCISIVNRTFYFCYILIMFVLSAGPKTIKSFHASKPIHASYPGCIRTKPMDSIHTGLYICIRPAVLNPTRHVAFMHIWFPEPRTAPPPMKFRTWPISPLLSIQCCFRVPVKKNLKWNKHILLKVKHFLPISDWHFHLHCLIWIQG